MEQQAVWHWRTGTKLASARSHSSTLPRSQGPRSRIQVEESEIGVHCPGFGVQKSGFTVRNQGSLSRLWSSREGFRT
eukprot:3749551-Rhodomonas_salina.1